ncbi:MAG TPA: bestrophin family ion channel [Myxococcota bacterium]|nr:bestrophin family ion channel [Myxococcota bacterium]
MVSNRGTILGLMRWQLRNIVIFTAAAAAVVTADELHGWLDLPRPFELPTLPVAVIGGAIGIFVSFRSNAGYDRWWEARKLWGKLVNTSRHWSSQVTAWVGDREIGDELVRRQIAYVHLLRAQLRGQVAADDPDVTRWLTDEERALLPTWSNPNHALLQRQLLRVTALADAGVLSELRLQSLDGTVDDLLDVQGGCERIRRTPIPRGYGFIGEQLIRMYAVLLPLAVVGSLSWLAIPVSALICLAFTLISEAGRVLEDPFTMFWNGLPLSALSRTIERDLRSARGETELPPALEPDEDGILM